MRRRTLALVVLVASGCRTETHPAESAPASAPTPATALPAQPASGAASGAAVVAGAPGTWSFDADKPDAPPSGFVFGRTGTGRLGRWVVQSEVDAPSSPNVLAQLDSDSTDDRFPVAVVDGTSFRDVVLSVRCKPMAGTVDQACGLVLRYRDENNYYLTRANALENNVRLYVVEGGHRQQIGSWSGTVAAKQWHEYRFAVRGSHFEVTWDGRKVLETDDKTFGDAGKVGVWTKADSVTWFDQLEAQAL